MTLRENVPSIPRVLNRARNELAGAYAQIANLDWNLGRVRKLLAESGLETDTTLIFFSDHGDMHGSHGQFRKTSPFEESIRVPLIIGGSPALYDCRQGISEALVSAVDLAPTTLGLCGINPPEWMRGFDYSGLYDPARAIGELPDSAFIQIAIATGHGDSVDQSWRGIITRDGWKYVVFSSQSWLLFNLNEDPFELANLAHNTAFQNKRRELNQRLAQWIRETGDSFTLPKD